MAILFEKKGSSKVFFVLAILACVSRHALAADSANKNSSSKTQASTEVFDVKTKDIPAPDASKTAASGSEIPPPDFKEFEDDKFINNLLGEDASKTAKPGAHASPAIAAPPLATIGNATSPLAETSLKAQDEITTPTINSTTKASDPSAPIASIVDSSKTETLPSPTAPTSAISEDVLSKPAVAEPPATKSDLATPEALLPAADGVKEKPPVTEEKSKAPTDLQQSPGKLTPEDKEKYAELKNHLLNFVARSAGKPAQLNKEIATGEAGLVTKYNEETKQAEITVKDTSNAIAANGSVQTEAKPTEAALPQAPLAQAPTAKTPDAFNDFLEPEVKKPESIKADSAPVKAPMVAQPVAPVAPQSEAPRAPSPAAPQLQNKQVIASPAPAPINTDIKNEPSTKTSKPVDIVAQLPPKRIDEEHVDKIEVEQPQEREKLSDADKAYLQLLSKQREALPDDKKLSRSSISTLEGISGELAPLKKGEKKEPQHIKVEHGDTGQPGKDEDGVIKSQSKMDISVRKVIKGEDLEKSKVKLGKAYKALLVGQNAAAISIYKEVLDKEPKNKDAMFGLATAYHKNNQYEQAREIYTQILKKDPADKEALNNFLVLVAEEAPEDALIELEKLERINSNFSPIAAQIAMINLKLGNPEKAARYLRRAILLSPDNLSYKYNLAVVYDKAGKEEQALPLYRQVVEAANTGGAVPGSVDKITARMDYLQKKISDRKE